jgi:carboxyl-terminal processing protease
MLEDGYGYVRLAQFQEGSSEEFAEAIEQLQKKVRDKKLKGLVIDLRNDPGGLLQQAIRVADLFLKSGVIVYTDGRLESQKQKYFAHDDGDEPTYPIVVLVNGGSASASEIVAGAFQDHGRAVIVGEQSFGKGSVQTILPMDNGAALRLTTALYYTKSGRSIQAQGITPDVTVPSRRFPKDSEEVLDEEDPMVMNIKERDLPNAIKNPTTKPGAEPAPQSGGEKEGQRGASKKGLKESEFVIGSRSALELSLTELMKEDPQLEEGLRILKSGGVVKSAPPAAAAEQK